MTLFLVELVLFFGTKTTRCNEIKLLARKNMNGIRETKQRSERWTGNNFFLRTREKVKVCALILTTFEARTAKLFGRKFSP